MISNIFLIILYNLFYYYIYYLIINILYNLYKISSKMIDKYYCKWFTGVNFIILKKSLFWFLIGSLIPHLVQLRQVVKWRKWGMTQVREWSSECSPDLNEFKANTLNWRFFGTRKIQKQTINCAESSCLRISEEFIILFNSVVVKRLYIYDTEFENAFSFWKCWRNFVF